MMFIDIANHPIMLWLGRLRVDKALDPATDVRSELIQLLENFTQLLAKHEWPNHLIEDARYAICAGLDEAAMNRADHFSDTWSANPLQLSLFDDYTAGNGFYTRLDKLRQDTKSHAAAIGVFWLVLCHGFCGKLSLSPLKEKIKLTDDIRREIEPYLPKVPPTKPPTSGRSWHLPWSTVIRWTTPAVFGLSLLVVCITVVNEYQRSAQLNTLIKQTTSKE